MPTHPCHEVETRLNAFLDSELTDVERASVERHLESCKACQRKQRLLALSQDSFRALEVGLAPEGFESRLSERLDQATNSSATVSATPPAISHADELPDHRPSSSWLPGLGLAAAAAITALTLGLWPQSTSLPSPETRPLSSPIEEKNRGHVVSLNLFESPCSSPTATDCKPLVPCSNHETCSGTFGDLDRFDYALMSLEENKAGSVVRN